MHDIRPIEGLFPVVPTPLSAVGIDSEGCRAVVEYLAPYVDGITILGSMGEGPSLTVAERTVACEAFVEAAAGQIGVVLGIGANALGDVIEFAKLGERLGVDALFLPAPGYYASGRHGLRDFFLAAGDATDLPVVLYDNPYVTGVRLDPSFMADLAARAPSFKYVKVTDRAPGKVEAILAGAPLVPLCGSDDMMHAHVLAGARGALTGVPCVAPRASRRWWDACESGDLDGATSVFAAELSLMAFEMMGEGDDYPAFAKACLRHLGVIRDDCVRPPLVQIGSMRHDAMHRSLTAAGAHPVAAKVVVAASESGMDS